MKIFIINLIAFASIGLANAQTISLEAMAKCSSEPSTCPKVDYIKDINHLLDKYTGTWKGSYEGKTYVFNFIKQEKLKKGLIYEDCLIGRVKIINQQGIVEFYNFNTPDEKASWGYGLQKNLRAYTVYFFGGKLSCIDYGLLYLFIKPERPHQMKILFLPSYDITTQDCSNFKTTIPSGKGFTLTKQ